MGQVIEGGSYISIGGQTVKAGTSYISWVWPQVHDVIQYPAYNGVNRPVVFVEIGDGFSILDYYVRKFNGFENLPRETIYQCYDADGNEVPEPSIGQPYFFLGYEYISATAKVRFYGGFGAFSPRGSILAAYNDIGYGGCSLDDGPNATDRTLAELYFFTYQEKYIPDLTGYNQPWGVENGFYTLMNGEAIKKSNGKHEFFNTSGLSLNYDIVSINISYEVIPVEATGYPDLYVMPNPYQQDDYFYVRLDSAGALSGAPPYQLLPAALIDNEPPGDVHYDSSPAPVGIGGNGQFIFDPYDLDGSLDLIPTNGAAESGFVHLYAPTLPQLRDLTNYLWTDDFYQRITKVLADPMDAIINLMRVPIDLTQYRGAAVECIAGNVGTGVSMAPLTESFIELQMGTIKLTERWSSALDYNPYTAISAYLPYIGYIKLDTNDIFQMQSWGYTTLKLKYLVNAFTGECVARLEMEKNKGERKGKYRYLVGQYAGNLGMNIPVTAANYSTFFSNLFNAAVSGVTAVASGGAAAGISAAASVTSALTSAAAGGNPDVQRSGNFSGGSSPLEYHVPFLMIETPIQVIDVPGYGDSAGFPTSCYRRIADARGFLQIEAIVLDGFTGTDGERTELEKLLKEGVINNV
jgi:hypothetical protein